MFKNNFEIVGGRAYWTVLDSLNFRILPPLLYHLKIVSFQTLIDLALLTK